MKPLFNNLPEYAHKCRHINFRITCSEPEFLLAHPGGPYYRNKDEGNWTIPKGNIEDGEAALEAAIREFEEETGLPLTQYDYISLPDVRYKNKKLLKSFALEDPELDLARFKSNMFKAEWPPRSKKFEEFPEIDRISFFSYSEARHKIHPIQLPLIEFIAQQKRQA